MPGQPLVMFRQEDTEEKLLKLFIKVQRVHCHTNYLFNYKY